MQLVNHQVIGQQRREPEVATIPARDDAKEYDLIVNLTSNGSKATLEVVQGAQLQEMIAAAVHTLNLPVGLAPDLKWHAHRRSEQKEGCDLSL